MASLSRVTVKLSETNADARNCPFCRDELVPPQQAIRCPACGTMHHGECWVANGNRCTTFGCRGRGVFAVTVAAPAAAEDSSVPPPVDRPAVTQGYLSLEWTTPIWRRVVAYSLLFLLAAVTLNDTTTSDTVGANVLFFALWIPALVFGYRSIPVTTLTITPHAIVVEKSVWGFSLLGRSFPREASLTIESDAKWLTLTVQHGTAVYTWRGAHRLSFAERESVAGAVRRALGNPDAPAVAADDPPAQSPSERNERSQSRRTGEPTRGRSRRGRRGRS
ncbi:MAG: hypothetical protein KC609_13980 [Myxococcales bacterium]|nr:hypothetical protein [Myxococcales bacterium]